jgi:alkylation response protein AidB-like acyl-CoA dehydrogenase
MIDTWRVVGLKGTGSDSYAVKDLFVPAGYAYTRELVSDRREQGLLYRFSSYGMFGAGFGALSLGLARAMLDAFIALAQHKTPYLTRTVMRDSVAIQGHVGLATARLSAARALLLQNLRDAWSEVTRTGAVSFDTRIAIRAAATFATHEARHVVEVVYHHAGATAIFESNPFERRMRDMHAVAQQIQGHDGVFAVVGRHALGVPVDFKLI